MKRQILTILSAAAALAACAADSDWTIEAARVDTMTLYVGATAANGELGIRLGRHPMEVENVYSASLVTDGSLGDGSVLDVSRLLPSINPFALKFISEDGTELAAAAVDQAINMRRAVHSSVMAYPGVKVTYEMRALRSLPHAGMVRVGVKADRPVEFYVVNSHDVPGLYGDKASSCRRIIGVEGGKLSMNRTAAPYSGDKETVVAMSAYLADGAGLTAVSPDTLLVSLKKGQEAQFDLFGVICTSEEYRDPWNEAERQLIYALREGGDRLVEKHEGLWTDLWKKEVSAGGDEELTRQARFALYNLYSNLLPGSRRSLAPLGLTGPGYFGHIFWDAETWMYPVVLYLNPELARDMINYRVDGLDAARVRARAHGYRGAMFPWESDVHGEESTPTSALTGPLEHHITADVANGAWDYFVATGDTIWLSEEGYPLIKDCADFWASRAVRNPDGSYSIKNVVGADEYAVSVDDNAFTNGAAQRNLRVAALAAGICGRPSDPKWKTVADHLRFITMDNGVTAEYDGYDGRMIKQADVNLLAYPLDVITDPEQIRRDLDYYSERLDRRNGPAMARSVLAVLYDRIGDRDEAMRQLEMSYKPHLRAPFGVFAETPLNNNCYFLTGAGAFLQALIELFPQK
ncbi:MAG: glycoside hydrolase family 65 protein [Muribaculaceae bacterium]